MNKAAKRLSEIPDEAKRAMEGDPFSDTLKMLSEKNGEDVSPVWLEARIENALLKCSGKLMKLERLKKEAEGLVKEGGATLGGMNTLAVLQSLAQKAVEEKERFSSLLQSVREAGRQKSAIPILLIRQKLFKD